MSINFLTDFLHLLLHQILHKLLQQRTRVLKKISLSNILIEDFLVKI